ncbi:MAG: triose-phosphate isomerase [Peptococcaceae bacterium]|nr:triose-phosphate isomerase [Peptococcaceae bacterium]
MREPVIAGNWKMYKTIGQAVQFAEKLKAAAIPGGCRVVICPPFTALPAVSGVLRGTPIGLGAQNMHHREEGAFTGEVSPLMLKDAGCRYVILGHSERRQYFGETDRDVNLKVAAALDHQITPIVCVGELLEEREAGRTGEVVARQVLGCLNGLNAGQAERLIIAYEPVWAIGTGRTASAGDAQQVNRLIRDLLAENFGREVAQQVPILYGGSVKPGNAGELTAQPDIDGALVGGASLDPDSFIAIIRSAVSCKQ